MFSCKLVNKSSLFFDLGVVIPVTVLAALQPPPARDQQQLRCGEGFLFIDRVLFAVLDQVRD